MELTFQNFLITFAVAFIVFLVIDMIWLLKAAKKFYSNSLKSRLNKSPSRTAALSFYVLFITGLVYFAIYPGLVDEDFHLTFFNSALYGLFTYSTFGLTNYCVLKNWPKKMTIIDIAWGMLISSVTGTVAYIILEIILL